ncbi:unnamed protein product [Nippostrongylus brasiliensis]|uniref:Uncharacterized protein n=1 Tax=Nippostrongylus brasiliensis TaxID=27835 RepID=A0A0N4XNX4_NIPBR|nr:unnamed protein product [Nippostrongylus brasiliensis]
MEDDKNGITNNFEDVMSKNAVHDVAPNTKMELGKRKKGKKEKKENVVMAETLPGESFPFLDRCESRKMNIVNVNILIVLKINEIQFL